MAERPEDLSLPIATVSRVINDALPANINVSAETRKTIAKAASVFVLYTTATASAMAIKAGRKTMNAHDVMEAISDMDFPHFREPLENNLEAFKETQKKKKESNSAKKQSVGAAGDRKSASEPQEDDDNVVILSDSD